MFITFPKWRLRISALAVPASLILLWLEGPLPFAIMLSSAFLHELGHLFAMLLCEKIPRRVDVLPMGAVIVCPEGIPDRDECIIALGGPLVSLLCALTAGIVFLMNGNILFAYAAVINGTLGIFNLMPVSKLDGGKALKCFLNGRDIKREAAEHFCSAASLISKALFTSATLMCVIATQFNLGVIALSIALLLQILFN